MQCCFVVLFFVFHWGDIAKTKKDVAKVGGLEKRLKEEGVGVYRRGEKVQTLFTLSSFLQKKFLEKNSFRSLYVP